VARAPVAQQVEAPPESDRLGAYPHPRETRDLFGHAQAEAAFARAVGDGRLPHGWLITGPAGIGKATLAYRLARFLLARQEDRLGGTSGLTVDPECAAARQVLALSHPGLLVLRRQWDHKAKRFGASISVDDVRRLKAFLGHTSDFEGWRVVIVDPADDLNTNAANAVLKSLEEPPVRTVFLLLSAEPGRLLTTIRSRCRLLALQPLGGGDLRKAVDQAVRATQTTAIDPSRWAAIEAASAGSVRRALAACDVDGTALREKSATILSLLPKVDWPAVHALAEDLSATTAEERYDTFFEELLAALAASIRRAAGVPSELGKEGLALRGVAGDRLVAFAEAYQAIVNDKAECDRLNLDRKATILGAVNRLSEAAVKG
jgi:DNA polymerase-3 subunit delta'